MLSPDDLPRLRGILIPGEGWVDVQNARFKSDLGEPLLAFTRTIDGHSYEQRVRVAAITSVHLKP